MATLGHSVHSPPPTHSTMLMLIHSKSTYYSNITFMEGGEKVAQKTEL